MQIDDKFETGLDPAWKITETGDGAVIRRHTSLHLTLTPDSSQRYHNAQISDYDPAQRDFKLVPPLRIDIHAYSSLHPNSMVGTAGFGLWNHPYAPLERGWRFPQAIWFFFAAPPSNMALARGVPGSGWKAASLNARRAAFYSLLPLSLPGFLMMRVPALYRALWPVGQRSLAIHESLLTPDLLTAEHHYVIEWLPNEANFYLDGALIQRATGTPRNPMGFIAWMDNQYAIVTPQGQFHFGIVDIPRMQALVLKRIQISSL